MSGERGTSHTNLEIGRTLERARTERGLSLWQVEEGTKIRARYLHDLERENFDVLPAVYVLGSLKTYADFLGLDGEALVRELKDRQAPPPGERDPEPEKPTQSERGGLPIIGGRDTVEESEDAAPATVLGPGLRLPGLRLYLGLGAVLILVLAVALGSIFADGGQPAVSQVRGLTSSEAPSRIAFSGDVQDGRDDERNQDANGKDGRIVERDEPPNDEEDKKEDEGDQAEKEDQDDEDGTPPEDTGDVAVTLPASPAASASASTTATSPPTASASASASAVSASAARSTPVAVALASPSSAATVPASTAPAATPDATAPEAGAAPRPAVGQPTPRAAGAPAGPRQVVVTDGTGSAERIVGKVKIVRVR